MTPFEHERYREMAAPYILGALEAEERTEFKAHLAGCEDCARLVAELAQPVAALPLAVPQVAPPPGLRDRVMSAIAAEAETAAQPAPSPSRQMPTFTRMQYAIAASIAVLAIIAVSFFAWAVGLRGNAVEQEQLLARSYEALSVMARADQRWDVEGTDAAPGAAGVVAYDTRTGLGSLIMWGLDDSPDVEYNVWVVEDGERERAGRLYAAEGGFWAVIDYNVPESEGIGVTLVDESGERQDVLDTRVPPPLPPE